MIQPTRLVRVASAVADGSETAPVAALLLPPKGRSSAAEGWKAAASLFARGRRQPGPPATAVADRPPAFSAPL